MLRAIPFILLLCSSAWAMAQSSAQNITFVDFQRTYPKINEVLLRKEDTLRKQFEAKGLAWPAKYMYIRSFKYDSQLEVWVKYGINEKYKLFNTYKVCALAGSLGPKRMQGDYQVPEGFYYINEFNPRSMYHLSLGLNYPNVSDRILSDSIQPGGDIYIHGSCVTTGCIPITDKQIEDLYVLAMHAKNQGQDFIPVHIFPVHFKNKNSNDYLARYLKDFPEYASMVGNLRNVYNYFEKHKEVPLILVNKKGEYVTEEVVLSTPEEKKLKQPVKKRIPKKVPDIEIAKVVNTLPVYPGGSEKFSQFLSEVSTEMAAYLEEDQTTSYVLIEFIIDENGKPIWAQVSKGGNDVLNEKLEEMFERMPDWKPAVRLEKNVAVKLKQTVVVEKKAP
ncbi:MAG TPA: L,D-transpeptidase family protein [Chitinophagaceae bacterium]|nr:L,D-transpeptidase family protein [Chitinophagaceae bacterium]